MELVISFDIMSLTCLQLFFSPIPEKFDVDENITLQGLLDQISQKFNVPTQHLIVVKHKDDSDDMACNLDPIGSLDDSNTHLKILFPNVSSFDLYLKIILHQSRKKKG